MLRSLFAVTALALAATPVAAATYTAKPADAAQSARIAARDILWNCTSAGCIGSTQNSRPAVICEGLAKKAGRLESFAVDGRALTADDLERCNSAAKAGRNTAVATSR